jgi:hypothetical protein
MLDAARARLLCGRLLRLELVLRCRRAWSGRRLLLLALLITLPVWRSR